MPSTHTLDEAIRNIGCYLAGEMALSELAAWADSYQWEFEASASLAAQAVATVELVAHEVGEGSLTEDQAGRELAETLGQLQRRHDPTDAKTPS